VVGHRELANYLHWATDKYPVTGAAGIPLNTSIVFDTTVTSLYLPLISGRFVILLPEDQEIEELGGLLRAGVEAPLGKVTPAHLQALQFMLGPEASAIRARRFVIGGEALTPNVLDFWRKHAPSLSLVDEYGPTEATVGCCTYEVKSTGFDASRIPIGRPTPNSRLYVLDEALDPTPIGVSGELYIGGTQVSHGYLNQPASTSSRFVPDPFGDTGKRMYRTGDTARWRQDGYLEFLGRSDYQVKIRGFRVELGEIEAALRADPRVQDAVAILDGNLAGSRLLAYVLRGTADTIDRAGEEIQHSAAIRHREAWEAAERGERVRLGRKGTSFRGWAERDISSLPCPSTSTTTRSLLFPPFVFHSPNATANAPNNTSFTCP
jgi:amino acid adenylation domain-containing protein